MPCAERGGRLVVRTMTEPWWEYDVILADAAASEDLLRIQMAKRLRHRQDQADAPGGCLIGQGHEFDGEAIE